MYTLTTQGSPESCANTSVPIKLSTGYVPTATPSSCI